MVNAINVNNKYQTSDYKVKFENSQTYVINRQKPVKKKNRIITPQWLGVQMGIGFTAGILGNIAGYLFDLARKNNPTFNIKSFLLQGSLWAVLFPIIAYILAKLCSPKPKQ